MESKKAIKCKVCGNIYYIEVPKLDMNTSFGITAFGIFQTIVNHSTCDDCIEKEEDEFQRYQRKLLADVEIDEIPFARTFDVALSPDGGALAKWIATNYQRKKNHLFIADDFNTGKTRSVCHVLTKLLERGLNCKYITCNDYLDAYAHKSSTEGKVNAGNWISSLLRRDVFVLDDVGKKKISFSGCEGLYNLLDYRYSEKNGSVALIYITANASAKDLIEKFEDIEMGRAFYSRLERMGFVASFNELNEEKI